MAQEAKVVNPDRQIDCIGLFCPMPIVKTREAITQMVAGEVLEMLSDDPASDPDMRSWAQNTGHELLEVTRDGAVYRFVIRKSR
jgi:tRNA 2-thiouridine synthesizing protein A